MSNLKGVEFYEFFNYLVAKNSWIEITYRDSGKKDEIVFKDIFISMDGLFLDFVSKKAPEIIKQVDYIYFSHIFHFSLEEIKEKPREFLSFISNFQNVNQENIVVNSFEIEKGMQKVLSISELTLKIKHLLRDKFSLIAVKGEIFERNLSQNGHLYFTLIDTAAALDCILFANELLKYKYQFEKGLTVECYGNLSLYEKRGGYQLVVQKIYLENERGQLQLTFEQLKEKLEKEGIFNDIHKKIIPKYPKKVVVITSLMGAVIQDIIKTTQIEYPLIEIIILPSLVQGEKAIKNLISQIQLANKYSLAEVMIFARGGGSQQDLQIFNDETLVRAIFASNIPIISAIGHEDDWVLCDYVADLRCATPTAAAEYISSFKKNLSYEINELENRLFSWFNRKITEILLLSRSFNIERLSNRLIELSQKKKQIAEILMLKANQLMIEKWEKYNKRIEIISTKIEFISPSKIMGKGYVLIVKNGKIVRNNEHLNSQDKVIIKRYKDEVKAIIE